MNMIFTLKKQSIKVFILSFFSFNLLFGTLAPDSFQKLINIFGIIIAAFVALMLIPKLEKNIQELAVKLMLLFFLLGALYSAYQAKFSYFQMNNFRAGIYFVIRISSFFVLIFYIIGIGNGKELAKNLFILALIYCLINDALLIPRIKTLKITQGYLLGNKFDVSYMHLEMLVLYIFQGALNQYKKKYIVTLVLYALIISLTVDCITGIMGILFFCIFFFFLPSKLIKKPLLWITLSTLSFVSVFNYSYIVGSRIYQEFFLGSLDRGVTLTGRINIYKKLPTLMSGHWLWGYGPSSSYEVIHNYLNMPNTQNGFWDIILQVGVVSFAFLAILVIYSIHQVDTRNQNFLLALLAMLDTFTVLSIFEITVGASFIGCVLLIAVYSILEDKISPIVE